MSDSRTHDQWTSRVGVILAVAGSAVGLGNFLRFPGVASHNGGGAFMIPYFCALIFLGIPIGWAEWTMGRYGGTKGFHSAPAIMGLFGKGPAGRYIGLVGVMIPLAVYFYYILVESWCLAYFWNFVTGGIGINVSQPIVDQVKTSSDFFVSMTGSNMDGVTMGGQLHQSVIFWIIVFALNLIFVYRGLSKGIEAFCTWAMPLMLLCGLVVLARVLTLGTPDPATPDQNVVNGLGFMWNPNFAALKNFNTWLAAAGQIFFSLSVGFGVIINYASYLKRRSDVVLSGLTASATNEFFEVALGGLITIPAAVVFLGIGLTNTASGSSFNLGFNTLPIVFAHMPFGDFFGATFFFMLFLAAITSSLSMLQPAKAFFEEALGISRFAATGIVTAITLAGSLFVIWFSRDLVALDTIDFWVGTFLIFIMAAAQIIFFGWIFGLEKGIREAEHGAEMRIPKIFHFVIKYIAPAYLIIIFVGFCIQQLPGYVSVIGQSPTVKYTLALLAAVAVILVVVLRAGERRWAGGQKAAGGQS